LLNNNPKAVSYKLVRLIKYMFIPCTSISHDISFLNKSIKI
jgi:hypothetical protein